MKRTLYAALMAALTLGSIAGCSRKDDDFEKIVVGSWHLVEVTQTKAIELMPVYVSFSKDGTFDIYMKVQAAQYEHYSGTWEMPEKDRLSGSYSNGNPFNAGTYEVCKENGNLYLTALNGSDETDVYEPAEIPSAAIENALDK